MENTTKYIDDVLYTIRRVLSSPESALFLTELYDEEYNNVTNAGMKNEELVLGSVLKRSSESVEDYNMLGYYTKEFLRYDIKKFYGLTLAEYLDSTSFFKRTIIKEAKIRMEELQREMENVSNVNKHTLDGLEEIAGG
jgi:hypothetical protein